MVLMLSIEPARLGDLLSEHRIGFSPDVASHDYVDMFGNTCTRVVVPPGLIEIRNDFLIADSGLPDAVGPDARQVEVGELPDDVMIYLLGSRYCDTQKLSELAWSLFGSLRRAGSACRRFATTPTTASASAINTLATTARLGRVTRSELAFVAISRISR